MTITNYVVDFKNPMAKVICFYVVSLMVFSLKHCKVNLKMLINIYHTLKKLYRETKTISNLLLS